MYNKSDLKIFVATKRDELLTSINNKLSEARDNDVEVERAQLELLDEIKKICEKRGRY